MSESFIPARSLFQIGDKHSGETFTSVSEVLRISGLGWARSMVSVVHLGTLSGYNSYLPTFRDGEVLTATMNFTAANWDRFRDLFYTQESDSDFWDFRVVLMANTVVKYTWEFQAFVQKIMLGTISPDDKQIVNMELKIVNSRDYTDFFGFEYDADGYLMPTDSSLVTHGWFELDGTSIQPRKAFSGVTAGYFELDEDGNLIPSL